MVKIFMWQSRVEVKNLSLGGFTEEAGDFCLEYGIGVADKIEEL